jgi:serine/threonine-protein phosphatase 5
MTKKRSRRLRNSNAKAMSISKVSDTYLMTVFDSDSRFDEALDAYSEAIFCNVPPQKKAVYYCNRAQVSIKTENYALALFDATDATKCDPTNFKAYYRLGSANLALNKFDLAIQNFKKVCQMQPNNKDARQKYEETVKEHRLRQFQSCLGYEDSRVQIKIEDISVEASYAGPKFEKSVDEITPEWVVSLMKWQEDQKVLHKKYACMIIMRAKEIFEKNKALVDVHRDDEEEITVCGDIHGQYYDLLNIFKLNGNPSKSNPYLFNGDFIDRGSFSVEVIMTLLSWKVLYPNHFFMSRGNHETKNLNKLYGFEGEVKKKYDLKVYDLFSELFCQMPLSHCINKKVFVTHGGLFAKDGVTLDDIRKTIRTKEPGDEGIMCECLWSDPCD